MGEGDGARMTVPPPDDCPKLDTRLEPPPPENVLVGADPLKLPEARPPDFAARASSGDPNMSTKIAIIAIATVFTLLRYSTPNTKNIFRA